MSKTYKTTEIVYHIQEGRPPVFVAGKNEEIPWEVAVKLGLVKDEKPAAAKARKADDVENKAVKPARATTKNSDQE